MIGGVLQSTQSFILNLTIKGVGGAGPDIGQITNLMKTGVVLTWPAAWPPISQPGNY